MMSFLSLIRAVVADYSPVQINPPGTITAGPATLPILIDNVLRFGLYAIGVIGVVMMTYSGFMYVISVGKPEKTKLALNSIIYTAVGFGIAIVARSLVEFFVSQTGLSTTTSLADIITNGLGLFMWVIGVAGVIVIVISGLLYVVSGGDPGKTKTAKDAILYAAVGLGVAIIGGTVIQFVARIFG